MNGKRKRVNSGNTLRQVRGTDYLLEGGGKMVVQCMLAGGDTTLVEFPSIDTTKQRREERVSIIMEPRLDLESVCHLTGINGTARSAGEMREIGIHRQPL